MKKRISVEDLQSLTDAEREKLRKWWKPKRGDIALVTADTLGKNSTALVTEYIPEYKIVKVDFVGGSGSYDQDQLTLLVDIGQMIEMLDQEAKERKEDLYIEINHGGEEEKELCDALFEAVKSILRGWVDVPYRPKHTDI